MKSNYFICVNGDCVATSYDQDWALDIADMVANHVKAEVTVNDVAGTTIYTVSEE